MLSYIRELRNFKTEKILGDYLLGWLAIIHQVLVEGQKHINRPTQCTKSSIPTQCTPQTLHTYSVHTTKAAYLLRVTPGAY